MEGWTEPGCVSICYGVFKRVNERWRGQRRIGEVQEVPEMARECCIGSGSVEEGQ